MELESLYLSILLIILDQIKATHSLGDERQKLSLCLFIESREHFGHVLDLIRIVHFLTYHRVVSIEKLLA